MAEVLMEESFQQVFRAETADQLERLAQIFLSLEENLGSQGEVINELFRLAHNIKGSSGMMGLDALKELMHSLEDSFDKVRSGKAELAPIQIGLIIQVIQEVQQYIADPGQWNQDAGLKEAQSVVEQNFSDGAASQNVNRTPELVLGDPENQEISAWQESGKAVYGIDLNYAPDCMLPGASAMVFLKYLEQFGVIFKTVPDAAEMISSQFTLLRVVLFASAELEEERITNLTSYNSHGEIGIQVRKWALRQKETIKSSSSVKPDDLIRVGYQKIDLLMEGLDELLTVKAELVQLFEDGKQVFKNRNDLEGALFHVDQIIRTLQGDVMSLGLIPIKQLFSRFPMIVRDIAHQSGKEIELVFEGAETEIDKRIAEQLTAPLTHLVRNAVDHGVETTDERRARGKKPKGKITMSAVQEGEMVVVRVSDDGRGLNIPKIRSKAIKNGLIKESEILAEDEVVQLIFKPGFSTAEQVTDVSGRGVGMDVVQNNIQALNGTIKITTKPNQGTEFHLRIPLTQAIISVFFIRSGGRIYGFPLNKVVEGLNLDPRQVIQGVERMTLSYRRETIPIFDLNEWFGGPKNWQGEPLPCVILEEKDRKIGILANEFIGQEKVLLRPLNNSLIDNPLIAGAVMLSNSEAALIINTKLITAWDQKQSNLEVVS